MGDIKETVYEHQLGDKHFTVFSSEYNIVNRVKRFANEFPNDVTITAENEDGSIVAHFPIKWIQIRKPRKHNLSDEYKEELKERIQKARKKIDEYLES